MTTTNTAGTRFTTGFLDGYNKSNSTLRHSEAVITDHCNYNKFFLSTSAMNVKIPGSKIRAIQRTMASKN